jgi:hypothetical protein
VTTDAQMPLRYVYGWNHDVRSNEELVGWS